MISFPIKVRVEFEVQSWDEVMDVTHTLGGREEPRKAWTEKEIKQVTREAILKVIHKQLFGR